MSPAGRGAGAISSAAGQSLYSACRARDGEGELEQKRLRKRSVKLALYEYCKKLTGVHPPWGSLTGIRPSRLYYEALEEGLDPVRTLTDVFDVTEDRARLLDEMHEMQTGLRTPPKDSFDVYIGIPFCKTARCAYCSFSSGEIGDGRLVAPYVEALKREIALSAQIAARKGFARPRPLCGRRHAHRHSPRGSGRSAPRRARGLPRRGGADRGSRSAGHHRPPHAGNASARGHDAHLRQPADVQ